jgi:hypothetical protein
MHASLPAALTFPDHRSRGRFPVLDPAGNVSARISTSWTGAAFRVHHPTGRVLCEASAGFWGLSSTWRVTDPDGHRIMTMTIASMRRSAAVQLERGGDYVVRGTASKRDFVVADDAGTPVLRALPRTKTLSLRPHDYTVDQTRPVFALPEFVALVQIWRMNLKGESAAAANIAVTGAYGGS